MYDAVLLAGSIMNGQNGDIPPTHQPCEYIRVVPWCIRSTLILIVRHRQSLALYTAVITLRPASQPHYPRPCAWLPGR